MSEFLQTIVGWAIIFVLLYFLVWRRFRKYIAPLRRPGEPLKESPKEEKPPEAAPPPTAKKGWWSRITSFFRELEFFAFLHREKPPEEKAPPEEEAPPPQTFEELTEERLGKLESSLGGVETAIEEVGKRLGEINTQVGQRLGAIEASLGETAKISEGLRRIEAQAREVLETTGTNMEAFNTRLIAVEGQQTELATTMESLGGAVKTANEVFEMAKQQAAMSERFQGIVQKLVLRVMALEEKAGQAPQSPPTKEDEASATPSPPPTEDATGQEGPPPPVPEAEGATTGTTPPLSDIQIAVQVVKQLAQDADTLQLSDTAKLQIAVNALKAFEGDADKEFRNMCRDVQEAAQQVIDTQDPAAFDKFKAGIRVVSNTIKS